LFALRQPLPDRDYQHRGRRPVAVRGRFADGHAWRPCLFRCCPPGTSPGMMPGTYRGAASVSDGTNVAVTMRLAAPRIPVASPSQSEIRLRLAEGGPAATSPFVPAISLNDPETGALSVKSVTASGSGVSAYKYADLAIVTLDPGS